MFIERIKATFIAQGHSIAQQFNAEAEREYLAACQDWARNGGQGGEPKPGFAVEPAFDFDGVFRFELATTTRPVSSIDPKTFLPKYGTDTDAVGGEVGGPIPNLPGRFYAAASAQPWLGKTTRVGDRRFVFTATTPFNRFWEEL